MHPSAPRPAGDAPPSWWRRGRDSGLLSLLALVALAWGGNLLWQGWRDQALGEALRSAARPDDIRMLSSTTCVFCARARAWMSEHRVPFDECFIERDAACAERYRQLGSPGTPTLLVRGSPQRGFDASRVLGGLVETNAR